MYKGFFGGLLLIAACSGCHKKAEGQTVAIVNGDEITSSELNAELAHLKLPNNADRNQVIARVLQGLVDRRLLAGKARKDGIDRSPEFISRKRQMEENLLIGMLASRQLDTRKLPTDAEISDFQAKQLQAFDQREVWKLSQVQYATPKDPALSKAIAASATMDQLAGTLTQNHIPFQRGENQLVTSVIPTNIYAQLVSLKPGEPFIVPNGDRTLASVVAARQASPLSGTAAKTEALNLIRRQAGSQVLADRLKELRASSNITYKPGFAPAK